MRHFKKHNSIGLEEIDVAKQVLESGVLSGFMGEWGPNFYGGPWVQKFEKRAAEFFDVKHAITFNSWTSGLVAAVGALDIDPGDEIIVTPWTMSATAMAILHWNAIPIFADINDETFCLDLASIESKISARTKAIMSADIFGQSADAEGLMKLGEKYNLKVISDSAQAIGSFRNGSHTGTLTDLGGFSLNHHKHIHTGEGGILVTNDDEMALRAQLIRNHAESVVGKAEIKNLSNMIGHNFRMTEVEAAIAFTQLPKLDLIIEKRQYQANYLDSRLSKLPGLLVPKVSEGNTHVYYTYGLRIDPAIIKITKWELVEKLTGAGVPNLSPTFANLHLLPIFQQKKAYGSHGFPWSLDGVRKDISYAKGICPNAEKLLDETFFQFYVNDFDLTEDDLDFICCKFEEVWAQIF